MLILAEMQPWCASWFCQTYPEYQGANPSHIVAMMVPFFVTVFVVHRLAIRPLLAAIEERESRTVGAREEAAELEAKFRERLAAYDARVAETRQAAADERARIRKEAGAEEERILGVARTDASKAVDDVRGAIETERVRVRSELRAHAERLAHELAEKALGRHLGAESSGEGARMGART